jgi:electron transfer flavoprotein beta subunit
MNIVVCIKQVPDTYDIAWDEKTGNLLRQGAGAILNPVDKHALEAAIQLKEKHGGCFITAISMGPDQAEDALREALGMGIDMGILLSDKVFAGADTLATSYALSSAIKKIEKFDMIMCGKESSDGATGHVGPQVAELLNLPQLTNAMEITVEKNEALIKQKTDDGFRLLKATFPVVITVEKNINQPRIPSMESIMDAYRDKTIDTWKGEDLYNNTGQFGLKGSPTQSKNIYTRKLEKGAVEILKGEPDVAAKNLIGILKGKDLL